MSKQGSHPRAQNAETIRTRTADKFNSGTISTPPYEPEKKIDSDFEMHRRCRNSSVPYLLDVNFSSSVSLTFKLLVQCAVRTHKGEDEHYCSVYRCYAQLYSQRWQRMTDL